VLASAQPLAIVAMPAESPSMLSSRLKALVISTIQHNDRPASIQGIPAMLGIGPAARNADAAPS